MRQPTQNADTVTTTLNRQMLRRAGVVSFNIVGGPGSGKTTLILQVLERLGRRSRIGVVATSSLVNPDAERFSTFTDQVVQISNGTHAMLDAHDVRAALRKLILSDLDLLFIENVSSLLSSSKYDLGEEKRVAVFSLAAGIANPGRVTDLIQWADLIVLNKVDLDAEASAKVDSFCAELKRLNPRVELLRVSAVRGDGINEWVDWVAENIGQKLELK